MLDVAPGRYSLIIQLPGFRTVTREGITLRAGDTFAAEFTLERLATSPTAPIPEAPPQPPYRTLPQAPPEGMPDVLPPQIIPPAGQVFRPVPNRWGFDFPAYRRYGPQDEAPYVPGHWYDPFNRNKLKGDYPIFGQQNFLAVSATSDTFAVHRRIPIPSGLGSADPDSQEFFGKFGQTALVQTFAFRFDLYHGDTSFRPIDWRIRLAPEININYVRVGENGILSPDVRKGTTRLDSQVALQEAFFEARMRSLSRTFDTISVRAGTQAFNSDFRGFLFYDNEPGLRVFGNLGANRWQYNAAYFAMLEKDSNSGLNSFRYRHQGVFAGNLYRQDFLRRGYTLQLSFHYDKDDASVEYDTNGFLVRPAPVGLAKPHAVRAQYYGIAGDGHIGRLNLTHAFYQVLGHDTRNPIAGRRTDINAQMAAVEVSMDRDWLRYKGSFFFASGDKDPRDGTARGFDAIFDNPNFAGGFFSFWNREGIRLTGSGVGLVSAGSLLPSLRSSKSQGQANFVNPGVLIFNGGLEADLTPKLRAVANFNWIRFHHPEPIALTLFQSPIGANVGADAGLGLVYRPPLTDNIVISGVFNTFHPAQGFVDIFAGKTLFSAAANVRFSF